KTGSTDALNGRWHDLEVTYSDRSGRITLYLDDEEIGSVEAHGQTQPRENWNPSFGHRFETGFDGLLDDITFLDKIPGERGEIEMLAPDTEEEKPDPIPAPEEEDPEPAPPPEEEDAAPAPEDEAPDPEDEAPDPEDESPDPTPSPGGEVPDGVEYVVADFSSP